MTTLVPQVWKMSEIVLKGFKMEKYQKQTLYYSQMALLTLVIICESIKISPPKYPNYTFGPCYLKQTTWTTYVNYPNLINLYTLYIIKTQPTKLPSPPFITQTTFCLKTTPRLFSLSHLTITRHPKPPSLSTS